MRHMFKPNTLFRCNLPLYGIPEAGAHWNQTYSKHHIEKLDMRTSTFDGSLFISNNISEFGIIGMQVDDSYGITNDAMADKEEQELHKANFKAKDKMFLEQSKPLTFNGCFVNLEGDNIYVSPKTREEKIQLVDLTADSEERMRQFRSQRARGAFDSSTCQPEAAFDLSAAAQQQANPTIEGCKALNERLKWQINNPTRGLRNVPIDLATAKLFCFADGSFANNDDLTSQIGYVIVLGNEIPGKNSGEFTIRGNIVHYSSHKCQRVTRAVLASELYAMVSTTDMAISMSTTLKLITDQLSLPKIPVVICTDSFSLYECLIKLGTTKEKRLMIDIMALRQSYERRELAEIRWIHGLDNPADAFTKAKPTNALKQLIDTNELTIRVEGWVQRPDKL